MYLVFRVSWWFAFPRSAFCVIYDLVWIVIIQFIKFVSWFGPCPRHLKADTISYQVIFPSRLSFFDRSDRDNCVAGVGFHLVWFSMEYRSVFLFLIHFVTTVNFSIHPQLEIRTRFVFQQVRRFLPTEKIQAMISGISQPPTI